MGIYYEFERASQFKNPCPNKTLVVIDMQNDFIKDDEHKLVPIICELIIYARRQKWAIIVVEYYGCGKTNGTIIEAVKNYEHFEIVYKSDLDGGKEIIDCLYQHDNWSLNLLVCGIYGDACVPRTIAGLFDSSSPVEVDVVTDAVYPSYCSSSVKDEYIQQQERKITTMDIYKGLLV